MQVLWSRVAEAQLCSRRVYRHIVACSSISITRRPAIRRRDTHPSGTFTAPYSTDSDPFAVFKTAHQNGKPSLRDEQGEDPFAWFDSDQQNGDSLKHDGEAGALKTKASRPETQKLDPHPRKLTDMLPSVPINAIQALNSICDTEETLLRHMKYMRSLNYCLRAMHRVYEMEPTSRRTHAKVYHGMELAAVQLAVDHEHRVDNMPMREALSTLQFERYHDMINQMVNRLVIQSYYDELPDDPIQARRNVESLDSAWTAIRMLRSEGYPRYNHPSADPKATKKAREELYSTITKLFKAWTTTNPAANAKFQVAKMCYNLLVCPVPPSIHHYNLLIVGFSRCQAHNLVDIVVDTFFNFSRLRPTPQTIVCLLVHYRLKRDILGFYAIIRRMMAIDNRGMLIRRRWHEDVVRISALHQWAKQPEVTTSLQANWVIERPSRNQDLYEALVSGLLSFDRVKDAVKVFIGSLQERVGISNELFIYLLKHCRYSLDTPAAVILARGLLENVDVVVALLLRDDCPMKLVDHLYPVLNMAEPPSTDWSEERVRMISHSLSLTTSPEDNGSAKRIKAAMFFRHTTNYLFGLKFALGPIDNLRRRRLRDPWHRLVIAQAGLDKLAILERKRARLSGTLLEHQVLQKLVRQLEVLTWDLGGPENLITLHKYIMKALRTHMPPRPPGDHYQEQFYLIAEAWLFYRIRKMHGTAKPLKLLLLRAQMHLLAGRRLQVETMRAIGVPNAHLWRSLGLSKGREEGKEQNEKRMREAEPAAAEEGSLWPLAESGAVRILE